LHNLRRWIADIKSKNGTLIRLNKIGASRIRKFEEEGEIEVDLRVGRVCST